MYLTLKLRPKRPMFTKSAALVLMTPVGWTQALSMGEVDQSGNEALIQLLYDGQHNPDFNGEVRFIRGVPLISRTPDTLPESQYYTSLILHAKQAVDGLFHAQLEQLFRQTRADDPQWSNIRGRIFTQTASRVLHKVLGYGDPISMTNEEQTRTTDGSMAQDHPHPHEGPKQEPMPVGFSSSRLEVTTGLHALRQLDTLLRKSQNARSTLLEAVGTTGVNWRVYDREAEDAEKCIRILSRAIPFVLHREGVVLLICGYATYEGQTYLMGYDLAGVERRVSIGGGGAISYSQYLKRKEEVETRGGNPTIELDPLFWDYASYFSVRNLECFRLVPMGDKEIISALYPTDLDTEKVIAIIREELEVGKTEYEKLVAKRLEGIRK